MPSSNILTDVLVSLGNAAVEIAADIGASVGNTYTQTLMQDAGWDIQSTISTLTQDRAQDASNEMTANENSQTLEIEREI